MYMFNLCYLGYNKGEEVKTMNEQLWSALIGLSKTVDANPKTENTDSIIKEALTKIKNNEVTQDDIDLIHHEKDVISPGCKTCMHPCGNTSDYDMTLINDKKRELMDLILNLEDINMMYRGLCYLGFDIDDSYIQGLIDQIKNTQVHC